MSKIFVGFFKFSAFGTIFWVMCEIATPIGQVLVQIGTKFANSYFWKFFSNICGKIINIRDEKAEFLRSER